MRLIKIFIVFISLCCSSKANGQLTALFTADEMVGCAPIRVQFTDNSTGGPTEWRWDLGNGTISPLKNPSTTYLTPGTYTVKLVVRKAPNDSSVLVKTNFITVYANPKVNFSGTPTSGCLPLSVQFQDSSTAGGGVISDWKWDFGDGLLGTGKSPVHSYKSPGNFQVTLTVTNSFGCFISDSRLNYITAFDSVKARFAIVAPNTCKLPATFGFVDSSIGTGITKYLWDFGDGTTSNLKNPSHTYTTAGSFDVSLYIRNINGCEDIILKKQAINAGNFKADFTLNGGAACVGRPVSFLNSSVPNSLLDSSYWIFGNGQTSNIINPTTSYFTTGSYKVKLTSWFGKCIDSTEKTITVIPQPSANFTALPTGSCKPPLAVQFNNMTVGGTVVKWFFGNGDSSTLQSPAVVYNSYGIFDVKLIVKNASGCFDTLTRRGYIKISPPKIDSIVGLPFIGCFPWTHNFGLKVTTQDPIVGYNWDFGDGTTSTLSNPQHTYTDTGSYTVKATILTTQGCTDTISNIVHGGFKPKADFEGFPKIVCPSESVFFKSLSTGIIDKWFWEFGDGGSSGEQHPAYKYTDTGWMTVKITVFNNGCPDTLELEKYIYVNPPISRFSDSFVCRNQFQHYFNESAIGATYWKWYIGNIDSFEARNTSYVFPDTGIYKIRLVVADSICEHESTQEIRILDEKAAFVYTDVGFCTRTTLKFTAKGPKTNPWNIKRYEWKFGDLTSIIYTDTPYVTHDYFKKGLVNVRLVITDLNNCMDTVIIPVNIRLYGPKANFGPVFTAICAGNKATFTDSTDFDISNPIVKWKWNFGTGADTTFTGPPFFKTYPYAGYYDVKLVVTDSLGCKDSLTRKVAVAVYKPKANFVSPDTLVCVNGPVNLVNNSSGKVLKASWDFGNGKTGTQFNGLTSYAAAGQYGVKLVIRDSLNCADSILKPKYITVGDAIASFSVSDSFTTCPPLVVSFTNKSYNNIINNWNFGNGNTSSQISPSHTYTTPGIFKVKLLVTGNGGCKDSVIKTIAIQGPSGKFNYAPLGGCPPLVVNFVANTINTRFITWDFSDGSSFVSTDTTATHIYDIPGNYVPKMILSDGIGCRLPIQGPDTIRVVGAKAYIKSLPKFSYCDSATISFTDSTVTTDLVISYKWTFGDGNSSTNRNPVHFYAKPGVYQVIFEVRTLRGCVSMDTLPANILIAPSPIISSGFNNPVCVPASVQFSGTWINQDTSTLTYKWNFGNGNSSALLNPGPVLYSKPGKFPISLIASNRYGCSDTSILQLTVNDTPRVVAGPAAHICLGASAPLKASGALQYQWDSSPWLSCLNCINTSAKPPDNQIFRVVGTDSNGCKSSNTVLIKVKKPGHLVTGPGDTLCVGESFRLSASGTELYLWQPPTALSSTTVPNPLATPVTSINYRVIGFDSLNCFHDTGYVSVVVYPIPKFNIIEDKIIANTGSVVTIKTTSSSDITRWHWTPPTGLNCIICAQPEMVTSRSITYVARVSNDGGCVAQDKVTVEPICTGENIFIPNTFSPNGDGQNDLFYPRGKGLAIVKSMRIFSRWGELLYERKDFAPNDPLAGWDGTFGGTKLTADVYVYMIDVICDNNVIFNLKGNITLLR